MQPNLGVSMCREPLTANIVHKQTMVMNKELTHHQPLLSSLYNICPGYGTQSLTTNKDNNKMDRKFIFTGHLLMRDFHLKLRSHLQER